MYKNAHRQKVVLLTIAPLVFLLSSCPRETGPPPSVQELEARVQTSRAKAAEIEAGLRSMTVEELTQSLREESNQGRELFNSRAYAEMLRRGAAVGEELQRTIQNSDREQLLSLLSLRSINEELYASLPAEQRVGILVNALRDSRYFNTWGLPHLHWEGAARILISEGEAAEARLSDLLQDKRPAPFWGDEEMMESQAYQYRVCDYAWAMLQEIRGMEVKLDPDPEARDRAIQESLGKVE